VKIRNYSYTTYTITIKNNATNVQVYSGTVGHYSTLTVPGLSTGQFTITARAYWHQTLYEYFSLPAEAGQTVMTIF
jgi:hypothetical protein